MPVLRLLSHGEEVVAVIYAAKNQSEGAVDTAPPDIVRGSPLIRTPLSRARRGRRAGPPAATNAAAALCVPKPEK
jgi:hypothetical protein